MKYSITHLVILGGAVVGVTISTAFAESHKRASAPVVITLPAIPDGSNFSRAPFPAARPQNDVLPPVGQAFPQDLPPNTPSTTPDPLAPPVPVFALFQPRPAPGLMPTGRPTIGTSAALEPTRVGAEIRATPFESRADLVDSLRIRMRTSEGTLVEFRHTENQMSAENRDQFKSLTKEADDRRKVLEHSLRAAVNANSADWESARAELASAYGAYAAACAQTDAAVGVRPAM